MLLCNIPRNIQPFHAVGIVLFFIVEKIVRYVEDNSQRGGHSHGHHHHHHKRQDISDKAKSGHIKSDDEGKDTDQAQQNSLHDGATGKITDAENEQESNATKVYLILVDINSEGIQYVLLSLQILPLHGYLCVEMLISTCAASHPIFRMCVFQFKMLWKSMEKNS